MTINPLPPRGNPGGKGFPFLKEQSKMKAASMLILLGVLMGSCSAKKEDKAGTSSQETLPSDSEGRQSSEYNDQTPRDSETSAKATDTPSDASGLVESDARNQTESFSGEDVSSDSAKEQSSEGLSDLPEESDTSSQRNDSSPDSDSLASNATTDSGSNSHLGSDSGASVETENGGDAHGAEETCVHPEVVEKCTGGFCAIPPGCYIFGSPTTEATDCRAYACEDQVQATLTRPFLIAATEVTQMQWEERTVLHS